MVLQDGTQMVSKDLLLAFYPHFASFTSFSKTEAIYIPDFTIEALDTAITLPLLEGRLESLTY